MIADARLVHEHGDDADVVADDELALAALRLERSDPCPSQMAAEPLSSDHATGTAGAAELVARLSSLSTSRLTLLAGSGAVYEPLLV